MEEKMIDVGVPRSRGDITASVPAQPAGKNYPTLRLNDQTLPFLADHKVGDVIKLEVEVRITGTREAEAWDDVKGANYYDLEVRKVGQDSGAAD